MSVEDVRAERALFALPVKAGGLGVPDPTIVGPAMYATSVAVTATLTESLMPDGQPFCVYSFHARSGTERKQRTEQRMREAVATFGVIKGRKSALAQRRMVRSTACGGWLSILPLEDNGTALTGEQFRDAVRIRYGIVPDGMPARCDGCGAKFDVGHALKCKKGGHVQARHDDLKHEWRDLCGQALGKGRVFDEPHLKLCQDVVAAGDPTEEGEVSADLRGDVGAHGFWKRGNCGIFDVRVTDTDQPYQRNLDPLVCLARHEKEKKGKYLQHCLDRRRSFTPLVFSVDGLFSRETTSATRRLATMLAAKWSKQYSQVCGYVKAWLSLALVRANSRCLRAERCPIWRAQPPLWEGGDGVALMV